MGWEYLHWVDLTLIKLMEVVIEFIDLTKKSFWSKSTFLGSTKRYKKVQRPQNHFFLKVGGLILKVGGYIMKVVGKF